MLQTHRADSPFTVLKIKILLPINIPFRDK